MADKVDNTLPLAYTVLVKIAEEMHHRVTIRSPMAWVTHDDFCIRLKREGINMTSRIVVSKVLRPLQQLCLEHDLPDISALIIAKKKGDTGNLLLPESQWWDPYVASNQCKAADVAFWFNTVKAARDYEYWPEQLPAPTNATA